MDRIDQLEVPEMGLKTATLKLEDAIYRLHTYVKHGNIPKTVAETEPMKERTEYKSEVERITKRLIDITKLVEEIKRNINLE